MMLRHCQWESTLEYRIIYLFDGNCYYDTQYDIFTLTQKPYFWIYFLRICEKRFYFLFNENKLEEKCIQNQVTVWAMCFFLPLSGCFLLLCPCNITWRWVGDTMCILVVSFCLSWVFCVFTWISRFNWNLFE